MVDLKSMSKKKKAEYIWDYYKLHIIGTLVIISIVGSLIHSQLTKIDYVFNLTMIDNGIDATMKNNLESKLTSVVVKEREIRKQAIVDIIPPASSGRSEDIMPVEHMQRFTARLSVGELDVIFLDKSIFEVLVKQDILLGLDNIPGLDLDSIKSEKIEASGNDNKREVYAINAEDIKILKDMGFDTNNKVIGIVSSSKQKDKAILVLKWLLNR